MSTSENPEEILSDEFPLVEDHTEISEAEFFENPVPESVGASEQDTPEEIADLIFPENRRISVKIYAYVLRSSGKPVIKAIRDRETPEYAAAGLTEYEIRSFWTVPTAAQMDVYREECSEYNRQSGTMLSNHLAIRDMIVTNHLKELLLPPSYTPFPLKCARPNRLSGDTVKQLKSMHSGIYDMLYTEFISESCLIM